MIKARLLNFHFRRIRICPVALLFLILSSCIYEKENISYVDPFIGTAGHGHTYPGPSMPFGMVQLSPDTRLDGWDAASGYHYSDSIIFGFSHTHLSGTGVADYCDILIVPTVGEVHIHPGYPDNPGEGYASAFRHKKEKAETGYYRVFLDDHEVDVELTASHRVGLHRYTFPRSKQSNVILDLTHRDEVLNSYVKVVNEYEIEGFRRSASWAKDQHVYFVMQFSKPIKDFRLYNQDQRQTGFETNGRNLKASFTFNTKRKEEVLVKVAISPVSVNGARKNLEQEIPHWRFDRVRKEAQNAWSDILNRYQVEDGRDQIKRAFYTALYHQHLCPNIYMDVDSLYRGRDMLIHKAGSYPYYTLFSLWDTFRATHPLFTIMETERTNAFINTFLLQTDEGGLLPVWELSSNETGTMIGYHAVSVIADAFVKGIRGYDVQKAYQAVQKSAGQDHFGLRHFKNLGFIPGDEEIESVSKTLEYAYDDWCISQIAAGVDDPDGQQLYLKRSLQYRNLFDPETGFFRARKGSFWYSPFDPSAVDHNYTEANAWQYLFSVQHDLQGLIRLLGGDSLFTDKLDHFFTDSSGFTGRKIPDLTGVIGQYAHGNQPGQHIPFLYNYVGQPWKSQYYADYILKNFYTDQPDGLPGNEDCGQMSAWYIFGAMGFYPVTPGSGIYAFGSPQLGKLTLQLENGRAFEITTINQSDSNRYIREIFLNGERISRNYILHSEIMNGGTLEYVMDSRPNYSRGTGLADRPTSSAVQSSFLPVPFIVDGDPSFRDLTTVSLDCLDTLAEIHYQLVNHISPGTPYFQIYSKPFNIRSDMQLRFFSRRDSSESAVLEAFFYPLSSKQVTSISEYSPAYQAGGDQALVDRIRGSRNFHSGAWQGFEEKDLEVVIDLGFSQIINRLGLSCLHDYSAWIFMPREVIYELSLNGTDYEEVARVENDLDLKTQGTFTKEFTANIWQTARYVRVRAVNTGVCPDWHPAAGEKAWIFADELIIE